MEAFFSGMDPQLAQQIAQLSRGSYELREYRKQLLAESGCGDPAELLAALQEGRLPEHPGYERWLAAVLMQRREQDLRTQLEWRCGHAHAADMPLLSEHPLAELLEEVELPGCFAGDVRLHPDGLTLCSDDGLEVVVRMVSARHWSFEWVKDGALWRLDTAPITHPGVATLAHLHRPDGGVVADPLALDETDMVVVLQRVLDALAYSHCL